jgi:hypothetical protein
MICSLFVSRSRARKKERTKNNTKGENTMPPDRPPATNIRTRPSLKLDVEHYQNLLDAPDMSASEKRQLIEALWTLIVSFIDLGYEVSPQSACGQPSHRFDDCANEAANMLNSTSSTKSEEFAMVAKAQPETKQTKEAS